MSSHRNNNGPTLLLLLLLLLTLQANAFGRPRNRKQDNSRGSVETKNSCSHSGGSIENLSLAYEPYYNKCGVVGFVQKIPYQSTAHNSYSPLDVNFSSACVRCGICIAIVDRINQSLEEANDVMDSDKLLDQVEKDIFLKAICDHAFQHYTLREIDGERYIGDSNSIPGATLVATTADGHWESTLRKKCHDILDDVETQQLYKHWINWNEGERMAKPLVEILCRNEDSGRLRDCQNMAMTDAKIYPATAGLCYQTFDWRARVKVTAELTST